MPRVYAHYTATDPTVQLLGLVCVFVVSKQSMGFLRHGSNEYLSPTCNATLVFKGTSI